MPSVQVNFTDDEWVALEAICRDRYMSKREVLRWLVRESTRGDHPTSVTDESGVSASTATSSLPPSSVVGSGDHPTRKSGASSKSRDERIVGVQTLKAHDDAVGSSGLPVCKVCKLVKNAARPANCLGAS